MRKSPNFIDETGNRYGRLLVIEDAGNDSVGAAMWLCQCDCGSITKVRGRSLRSGSTKSCGCYCKEQVLLANRLPKGEAAFNYYWLSIRRDAKRRNLPFELTKEQVRSMGKQPCFYCGRSPSRIISGPYNGAYVCNGIDRVENTLGYTINNVVPCCKTCNRSKQTMSFFDFRSWVDRVHYHIPRDFNA